MTDDSRSKRTLVRRYMSIPALIDTLRRQKLAMLNPDSWDDRNDRLFMRLYKEHRKVGGLYGMCAALSGETYHHWKIFAGGASGACVVLRRRPLEAYLDQQQTDPGTTIRYGEIRYLRLSEVKTLSPAHIGNFPFLKRYGFKDEDEYRIVIETIREQQPAIFIDCPHEWIDAIYLNPWLYGNQAESLAETIRELPGCDRIEVKPSQLIDSTTWREAADRVTGRSSPRVFSLAKAQRESKKQRAKSEKGT